MKLVLILTLLISLTLSQEYHSLKLRVGKLGISKRAQLAMEFRRIMLHDYFNLVHICHDRYTRCSKKLHPKFCVSHAEAFGFYIWAKKLAASIIKQQGVRCPTSMMLSFYADSMRRHYS